MRALSRPGWVLAREELLEPSRTLQRLCGSFEVAPPSWLLSVTWDTLSRCSGRGSVAGGAWSQWFCPSGWVKVTSCDHSTGPSGDLLWALRVLCCVQGEILIVLGGPLAQGGHPLRCVAPRAALADGTDLLSSGPHLGTGLTAGGSRLPDCGL